VNCVEKATGNQVKANDVALYLRECPRASAKAPVASTALPSLLPNIIYFGFSILFFLAQFDVLIYCQYHHSKSEL
jgi:hypothetical protein